MGLPKLLFLFDILLQTTRYSQLPYNLHRQNTIMASLMDTSQHSDERITASAESSVPQTAAAASTPMGLGEVTLHENPQEELHQAAPARQMSVLADLVPTFRLC